MNTQQMNDNENGAKMLNTLHWKILLPGNKQKSHLFRKTIPKVLVHFWWQVVTTNEYDVKCVPK
jgi:hypothetical protein